MNTSWFLGVNTAEGFISRFAQLHPGGRVNKCVILKGGPGCGKSTFMKTLRRTAAELGADTESYPCSSDPASLDGLFIPALGLAFVDGTAPQATATKQKNRHDVCLFFNHSVCFFRFAACIRHCRRSFPGRSQSGSPRTRERRTSSFGRTGRCRRRWRSRWRGPCPGSR